MLLGYSYIYPDPAARDGWQEIHTLVPETIYKIYSQFRPETPSTLSYQGKVTLFSMTIPQLRGKYKEIIMKIFTFLLGITSSVVAIVIYAYFIKLRIKEAKKTYNRRRTNPINTLSHI